MPPDGADKVVAAVAAFACLETLAGQIGYLPALYTAYNGRETAVNAQRPRRRTDLSAGTAPGPRTGCRTGVSSVGTLPKLYAEWARWAADVTESHRIYLPLVYFR